ncbi:MAG: hypothetical protein LUE27_03055 [Clostridia bacterium]|nr:hypothetical protein [Clostridia bacterium]
MAAYLDFYDDSPSENQTLTFRAAARIFDEQSVNFNEDAMRELGFYSYEDPALYSNLAWLVSDQCTLCSKNTLFNGTSQRDITDWKTFTGSILDQISKTLTFLDICNKTGFNLRGAGRADFREYPRFALHEAVLNAFMHRDYSYGTDLFTHVFDDRMDVFTYGCIPEILDAEKLRKGVSVRRNRRLCALLDRLGYTTGHENGIPGIFRSYERCRRQPELKPMETSFQIILPNRIYWGIKGDGIDPEYDDAVDAILVYLRINRIISQFEASDLINTPHETAFELLMTLSRRGVLSYGFAGSSEYIFFFP